jgi:tetratricopeptide (TPR) repeat protein/predicted Ser/Thr protein kinase
MACLGENTFADYFDLKLPALETERLFAHVDECVECARLLAATAAHKSAASASTDPAVRSHDSGDGALPYVATLGRYRVERLLGLGGMGVVYAGHDPQLDRRVAIKLLRPVARLSAEVLRARLMREAQAMARLSHPNVINIYEIGAWGEQIFVVMELIDGTTLTEWLTAQRRSWREIVHAFVAAGAGLEAAHGAGVVHRDFKPDNVLVSTKGRICVTDFGLARISRTSDSEPVAPPTPALPAVANAMTYSGLLVGTPAYMAPEQLRGEPSDARSDLFSFCVALYQALYGTRPYAGNTVDELRAATAAGRLEPPRAYVGPRALRSAIERGLLPEPSRRPSSMSELLARLRVDPALRRRRWAWVALGVLVALGVGAAQLRRSSLVCRGAAGKLAGLWDPPERQRLREAFARTGLPYAADAAARVERALDGYFERWGAMRKEACEATQLRGEQSPALMDLRMSCLDERREEVGALVQLFAGANDEVVRQSVQAVSALSDLSGCADTRALLERVPPPRHAEAQKALAAELARIKALVDAGRYKDVPPRANAGLERARALGDAAAAAHALYLRGLAEQRLETTAIAEKTLEEASWEAEAGHDEPVRFAAHLALLGTIVLTTQRQVDATRVEGETRALLRRLGGVEREAQMLSAFARAERQLGHYALMRDDAERAVALRQQARPVDELALAQSIADLGQAHERLGEFARAVTLTEEARALAERVVGAANPAMWDYWNAAGIALHKLGKEREAESAHRRALAIAEDAFGRDSTAAATSHNGLGGALRGQVRNAEALTELQAALEIFTRRVGPNTRQVGAALTNISLVLSDMGRATEGRQYALRAIEAERAALGPEHPEVTKSLQALGIQELSLRRYQDAYDHFEEAARIVEKGVDPDSTLLRTMRANQGRALLRMGRPQQAIVALQRALQLFDRAPMAAWRAAAEFDLGQAIWNAGGDRRRARQLVETARGRHPLVSTTEEELAEMDHWLARHRVE